MELFGLISLIILQMLEDIMREQVKKSGNKPMVKLMVLFVLQVLEGQFQVLAMLLKKRTKI